MINIFLKGTLTALLFFGLLGTAPVLASEPIKIGILDLQKCLDQSEAGKKAKKILQDKSERIKKDLSLKRDELKKFATHTGKCLLHTDVSDTRFVILYW